MVGALVASQDRSVLVALGGAAFSVLIMVATLSSRTDALPTWIPIHLDAAGNPDRWGTASTLWRIPLMTAMLTLASVVAAIFISRRDPFAARCLIAGSLLVHVLAWIGLVTILW